MLPNQLLNEHLDNVAVRLRNPKPFTPNDFPAVKKIEHAIKNEPVEHAYMFDSTGMPVFHDVGDANGVSTEFYADYEDIFPGSAPLAFMTHNHPGGRSSLSIQDLNSSIESRITTRAVGQNAGGAVDEFNPGGLPISYGDEGAELHKLLRRGDIKFEEIPSIYKKRYELDYPTRLADARAWGFPDPTPINEVNPTYKIYRNPPPNDLDPVMATNSFAIRRVPTADEAAAVLGVIPTQVRGASQSAYVSRHATPEQMEVLKRSPSTGSTTNAYDPDAIHRAKMNAAASQGKWNGGGVYGSYGYRDW